MAGLLPAQEAADRSIGMLECGPAAGVIGSRVLGELLGQSDVIATDMGGTTFKVSVIQNGEIEYAREPMVDRFHYMQPKIEVVSIGSGGGSIVWLEEGTRIPRVGPRSAGARPGPVCYGLGGTEPTLTDVFMLIGYMDPNIFLGGTMHLDPDNARRVFDEKIARPLGMGVEEAAFGIYRIATAQISDLIHEITVERGLDPRDFVLHAFGGSCGIVAGMFGAELNVKKMVVPYTASVNCAFGLVSADIVHEYSLTRLLPVPSPPEAINEIYEPMIEQARRQLREEGFSGEKVKLEWSIDLRYSRQVHEVTTMVAEPHAALRGRFGAARFRFRGAVRTQIRQGLRLPRSRNRNDDVPADGTRPDRSSATGAAALAGKDASHAKIGRRPDLRGRQERHGGCRYLRFRQARAGQYCSGAGCRPYPDHHHRAAGQATRHYGWLSECADRFRCVNHQHDERTIDGSGNVLDHPPSPLSRRRGSGDHAQARFRQRDHQ